MSSELLFESTREALIGVAINDIDYDWWELYYSFTMPKEKDLSMQ